MTTIQEFVTDIVHKHRLDIDLNGLIEKMHNHIPSKEMTRENIDYIAHMAASLSTESVDYNKLATFILIYELQRKTGMATFSETCMKLKTVLRDDFIDIVSENADKYDAMIVEDRDFLIDYFGFRTLYKNYLLSNESVVCERIQHMWLRVSIELHRTDFENVKKTYDAMSQKWFTHATPTLFNSGLKLNQLSSCFLMGLDAKTVDGIFETLSESAQILENAGGLGVHVHGMRSSNSSAETGPSNGLIPMLKVFNSTSRFVDQARGKRKGSIAIWLEPWHPEIMEFLQLRKNHGHEDLRARDLFYGLWIPNLFMKRVEADAQWTLFCPFETNKLADTYGSDFERLYCYYEQQGMGKETVSARTIWQAIVTSQIETGSPYICYKDHVNQKSNQKNIGIIRSSNLCCEVVQYSDSKETAVCNLASVALPECTINPDININDLPLKIYTRGNCGYCNLAKGYLDDNFISYVELPAEDSHTRVPFITTNQSAIVGGYMDLLARYPVRFDFEKLKNITMMCVQNLNKVIDNTFYPTTKAQMSNRKHRPIGLGVQGLATLFMKMRIAFDSDEARQLNHAIFECMYYSALTMSNQLAKAEGAYVTFNGSPASFGLLQFDMWGDGSVSDTYPWDRLKESIIKFGLRNSLLLAPMPTASTAQILGNTECFEPITSNIYVRRTIAGEFMIINDYLVKDLRRLGIWNKDIKNQILVANGSIANINSIPDVIKSLYKTAWEMSQKVIIDLAADRGQFICQSQSMNLFMADPTYDKMSSMHFYAFKRGLKTGIYYLRTQSKSRAQQFTIAPSSSRAAPESSPEACLSCGA